MLPLAATLLWLAPAYIPPPGAEVIVCGRTTRFADRYCDAAMDGRRWGHVEAAEAHEIEARFALPHRAAGAHLAAANNWIAANQPGKAVIAFDRALAAGLKGDERRNALFARARAQAAVSR